VKIELDWQMLEEKKSQNEWTKLMDAIVESSGIWIRRMMSKRFVRGHEILLLDTLPEMPFRKDFVPS
jgi:hypothetical protein